ncbi:hypothetical protein Pelo_11799 [Pelomyxa schiedti]|nr:hypothetical protein Pelo_11799 [Pelomyxa schiedti]
MAHATHLCSKIRGLVDAAVEVFNELQATACFVVWDSQSAPPSNQTTSHHRHDDGERRDNGTPPRGAAATTTTTAAALPAATTTTAHDESRARRHSHSRDRSRDRDGRAKDNTSSHGEHRPASRGNVGGAGVVAREHPHDGGSGDAAARTRRPEPTEPQGHAHATAPKRDAPPVGPGKHDPPGARTTTTTRAPAATSKTAAAAAAATTTASVSSYAARHGATGVTGGGGVAHHTAATAATTRPTVGGSTAKLGTPATAATPARRPPSAVVTTKPDPARGGSGARGTAPSVDSRSRTGTGTGTASGTRTGTGTGTGIETGTGTRLPGHGSKEPVTVAGGERHSGRDTQEDSEKRHTPRHKSDHSHDSNVSEHQQPSTQHSSSSHSHSGSHSPRDSPRHRHHGLEAPQLSTPSIANSPLSNEELPVQESHPLDPTASQYGDKANCATATSHTEAAPFTPIISQSITMSDSQKDTLPLTTLKNEDNTKIQQPPAINAKLKAFGQITNTMDEFEDDIQVLTDITCASVELAEKLKDNPHAAICITSGLALGIQAQSEFTPTLNKSHSHKS